MTYPNKPATIVPAFTRGTDAVDDFGSKNLRELLEGARAPCVSIYLPTRRGAGAADAHALRFRAAVARSRELLEARDGAGAEGVLTGLEELLADREFWRRQDDGLAVFAAPGFRRQFRLRASLPELVSVGPTFHARPLFEYLQAPRRYWVLSLSQKQVRLWEGTADRLTPVQADRLPSDLASALGRQVERDEISFHSPRGPGNAPIYHGHGVGKDDAKPELERFFRLVDDAVAEILPGQSGPIVLAAVDYYHPMYRSLTRLTALAPEGIPGNVSEWESERLHEASWPIARQTVEREVDDALARWEQGFGRGKTEADLATAFRLAVAGRLHLLLTERGRFVWGFADPISGDISVLSENGADPDPEAVDLLNELMCTVVRHGGQALVLPAERMPTTTGVAAILR